MTGKLLTVYVNHVNRNFKIPRRDGNESVKKKNKTKQPNRFNKFRCLIPATLQNGRCFLKIGLVYGASSREACEPHSPRAWTWGYRLDFCGFVGPPWEEKREE